MAVAKNPRSTGEIVLARELEREREMTAKREKELIKALAPPEKKKKHGLSRVAQEARAFAVATEDTLWSVGAAAALGLARGKGLLAEVEASATVQALGIGAEGILGAGLLGVAYYTGSRRLAAIATAPLVLAVEKLTAKLATTTAGAEAGRHEAPKPKQAAGWDIVGFK